MTGRRFHFSSDGLTEDAAFSAYQRLYQAGSDVSRGRGPFHARLQGARLANLLLFERELSGIVHARSDRVHRDGFDHFVLHMVLSGELLGSTESAFTRAGPGDLLLVDMTRPSRTEARDLHVLTCSVSRNVMKVALGPTEQLHGSIFGAPDTLILRDMMLSITRNIRELPAPVLPGVTRALIEILGSTLNTGMGPVTGNRRIDFARREAAIRAIVARLGDRTLDATKVAEAIGQSRSTLYRLFEREGGVGERIMAIRLAAVRDALEEGSTEPLAILAERFGFADESHMNRRFNRAFGRPPGGFRREIAAVGPDTVAASVRRWGGWMSEIS